MWRTAAAVGGVLFVVLVVALLQRQEVFTGSNSVQARGAVVEVPADHTACVRSTRVPVGTGRIRWKIDPKETQRPALDVTVRAQDGAVYRGRVAGTREVVSLEYVDIPLDREIASSREFVVADVCVRPDGGRIYPWGFVGLGIGEPPLTVAPPGRHATARGPKYDKVAREGVRLALWYLPAAHETQTRLAALPDIAKRATLFRPSFVGPWVYWLILLAFWPLLAYGTVRLLAVADHRRALLVGAGVAGIAFAHALSWSFVTPAFQSPDESEHFSYVQYLAETGKAPSADPASKKIIWSTQEAYAIDATREITTVERAESKAPWLQSYEDTWRMRVDNDGRNRPRDDAGGYHPVTSAHSPLYYSLLVPGYELTKHRSTFSQLLAMRATSAVMGALTALFAFLLVLELLPTRRALAVAGGLFVALEPMMGFISGAVNNDNGVNMACAAITWLTVRGLRRGFDWPVAVALGLALGLAPLMKGTGYELWVPFLMVSPWLAWRAYEGGPRSLASLGLLLVVVVGAYLGWDAMRGHFGREAFTTPGGGTPGVSFGVRDHIPDYLSFMWQVLFPFKLPFMTDMWIVKWPFYNIYVERGFGSFGWYAILFAKWVYVAIVVVWAALLALAARALWQARASVRDRVPELLFLAAIPVTVVFAVEAAYFSLAIPLDGTAEQGRYGFPALAAVAAIAVAGCLGAGRRRALPVATGLVVALLALAWAGQWLVLTTFYS